MSLFRASSECKQSEIISELSRTYWMFRGRPAPAKADRRWEKLAARLKDTKIVPSRYVRWAYMQLRLSQSIPWITQIASTHYVIAFSKVEEEYVRLERLKLQLQLDVLYHRLLAGDTVKQVVANDLLDLGDAVRYAAARKAGVADSVERLRRGAELDLKNEPVYMSLLSPLLG